MKGSCCLISVPIVSPFLESCLLSRIIHYVIFKMALWRYNLYTIKFTDFRCTSHRVLVYLPSRATIWRNLISEYFCPPERHFMPVHSSYPSLSLSSSALLAFFMSLRFTCVLLCFLWGHGGEAWTAKGQHQRIWGGSGNVLYWMGLFVYPTLCTKKSAFYCMWPRIKSKHTNKKRCILSPP